MAAYSFKHDDVPTVNIEEVGSYDFRTGKKLDEPISLDLARWPPRYRVTIEYDFGPVEQEDGHAPAHGDSTRDFAERVLSCIKDRLTDEAFVKIFKESLCKKPL